jgi:hypothetical protein
MTKKTLRDVSHHRNSVGTEWQLTGNGTVSRQDDQGMQLDGLALERG